MDDRALMQMALDALKVVNDVGVSANWHRHFDNQIKALRDRLAQPEPEPIKRSFSDDVGRLLKAGKGFYDDDTPIDYKDIQLKIKGTGEDTFECVEVRIPRPPQREWVSLTDEEIKEIVGPWGETPIKGYTRKLFDQIEAKLREKNVCIS
jgi:hypothetical protein